MLSAGCETKPSAQHSAAFEALRTVLSRNTLAYKSAEYVYENASYVPHILQQGLSGTLLETLRRRRAPRQSVLTWDVPFPETPRPENLIAWLRARGVEVREGGHTFYIPPQRGLRRLMPAVVDFYPERCGFKILKDLRPPARARYLYRHRFWLRILFLLIGSPADQLIPANYMYTVGIGPRIWDLTAWRFGGQQCTVFVVEHVTGVRPTSAQGTLFLERLKQLNGETPLRILVPHWQTIPDFTPPECNGNLLYSQAHGRPLYVDFQNFAVRHPHAGTSAPEEPSTRAGSSWESTSTAIADLLRERSISFDRALVLDVGCRTEDVIRAALARGAAWAIGWCHHDTRQDIEQRLLRSGATRFSLPVIGDATTAISADIPKDLWSHVAHTIAVVRSGAGAGPVADTLRLPWRVAVVAGDARETTATAEQTLGREALGDIDVVSVPPGGPSHPLTLLIRR